MCLNCTPVKWSKKDYEQYETFKSVKRKEQIQAGAYDGRFRNKVVEDKKKKENKFRCRIKVLEY